MENSNIDSSIRDEFYRKSTVILRPGELYIAKKPALIQTLLGSCVSVVLHHPQSQISAMSHALLPSGSNKSLPCAHCTEKCNRFPLTQSFRYVDCSTNYLLTQFTQLGIPTDELVAKVFGGAKTLKSITTDIGAANVAKAHEVLHQLQIKLVNENTGGLHGRTIKLASTNGNVIIRHHKSSGRF